MCLYKINEDSGSYGYSTGAREQNESEGVGSVDQSGELIFGLKSTKFSNLEFRI